MWSMDTANLEGNSTFLLCHEKFYIFYKQIQCYGIIARKIQFEALYEWFYLFNSIEDTNSFDAHNNLIRNFRFAQ